MGGLGSSVNRGSLLEGFQLLGLSSRAPALADILGESCVLAHGHDLGELEVVGYREASHDDLVQLVGGFHVQNGEHPPLPGDFVDRHNLAGFHGLQSGFGLLLPLVPELVKRSLFRVDPKIREDQHAYSFPHAPHRSTLVPL